MWTVFKRSASKKANEPRKSRGGRFLAIGFEESPDVKEGTRYMATYATGVLPGREGLMGRAGGRRGQAYMTADLAEGRAELELGLHVTRKGGEA